MLSTHSVPSVGTPRKGLAGGRRLLLLVASLAAVAILASACGSSSSSAPTTTTSAPGVSSHSTAHITIRNYLYSPRTLTVKPGTKVYVTNEDSVAHTLTDTGSFDTGDINPDQTVSFTAPTKAGTYTYHCTIHPWMIGSLIVS